MLADAKDPSSLAARKALEDQRENAIKIALGPERYEEYQMLHDPVYRDAVAAAEEAGTPEAARTLYAINLAALAEQNRIRGNTNLTADQKSIELKRLELEQLAGQHGRQGAGLAAGTAARAARSPAEKGLCPRPRRQRGDHRPDVRSADRRHQGSQSQGELQPAETGGCDHNPCIPILVPVLALSGERERGWFRAEFI